MKTVVIVRGYPLSVTEYYKLYKKYPAFSVTVPNEAGLKHGRVHVPLKTCLNFTRTAAVEALFNDKSLNLKNKVVAVGGKPGELFNEHPAVDYTYVRAAALLVYDRQNPITKEFDPETNPQGFKWVTKSLTVEKDGKNITYTDTAPVITFGGKEYVWYNKEECENNQSDVMEIVLNQSYERSVPFNTSTGSNNYGETTYFIEQHERNVLEGCTKQELEMIVPVKMSSADGYEKAKPMFTENQLTTIICQRSPDINLDKK
ncbi:MAG: hypothetical protein K2K31_02055 [Clostridia bacterium]|nr:hypothetical protein [Clostridia bacterium]